MAKLARWWIRWIGRAAAIAFAFLWIFLEVRSRTVMDDVGIVWTQRQANAANERQYQLETYRGDFELTFEKWFATSPEAVKELARRAESYGGRLRFWRNELVIADSGGMGVNEELFMHFGFGSWARHSSETDFYPGFQKRTVAFPMAVVMLPLFIWTSFGIRRSYIARRTRARRQSGLCASCGYDLRGSGSKCPECGTAPEAN